LRLTSQLGVTVTKPVDTCGTKRSRSTQILFIFLALLAASDQTCRRMPA
jgi:hypothetical protein